MVLGLCLDLLLRVVFDKTLDSAAVLASLPSNEVSDNLLYPDGYRHHLFSGDRVRRHVRVRPDRPFLEPGDPRPLREYHGCVVGYVDTS
jgi:hypothetical protein